MAELDAFRAETRAWLEANCPPSMRTPMPDDENVWGGGTPASRSRKPKLWLERMAARGWTVPTWPKQYGGGGLAPAEARILEEEMRRLDCRSPLRSFGIWMLGPVLLEYGSEAQKTAHLPPIVRGEIRWCQGYSEPEAGSDLAGLRRAPCCKASISSSTATRSGPPTPISPTGSSASCAPIRRRRSMRASASCSSTWTIPACAPRPIRLISGASPFCETFFENVRVPQATRRRAQQWLDHRQAPAGARAQDDRRRSASAARRRALARRSSPSSYVGERDGKIADPVLRDRIAQYEMDAHAFQLTRRRAAEEAEAGGAPGPASAMFKYYGTELNKRKFELLLRCLGTQALGWEGDGFTADENRITREWLRSKANSIEGGTSEIQLNIIAKRVLGLPD